MQSIKVPVCTLCVCPEACCSGLYMSARRATTKRSNRGRGWSGNARLKFLHHWQIRTLQLGCCAPLRGNVGDRVKSTAVPPVAAHPAKQRSAAATPSARLLRVGGAAGVAPPPSATWPWTGPAPKLLTARRQLGGAVGLLCRGGRCPPASAQPGAGGAVGGAAGPLPLTQGRRRVC